MRLQPRAVDTPRWVTTCWAAAVLCGAAVVLTVGGTVHAAPQTLGPITLASYLARAAGPDARDIRVNGVYGSAHEGAWQFVAHISWHDAAGVIHGGTTNLPTLAGAPATTSEFSDRRLTEEEAIGWPIDTVAQAFRAVPHTDAALAFVELQITPQRANIETCSSSDSRSAATCHTIDRAGRIVDDFNATLFDDPSAGALSVSR